jgi:hypothetical protein
MFFLFQGAIPKPGFLHYFINKKIHHMGDGLFALSDPDKITWGFLLASRLKMKVHRVGTQCFFISGRNPKTGVFALLHQ